MMVTLLTPFSRRLKCAISVDRLVISTAHVARHPRVAASSAATPVPEQRSRRASQGSFGNVAMNCEVLGVMAEKTKSSANSVRFPCGKVQRSETMNNPPTG